MTLIKEIISEVENQSSSYGTRKNTNSLIKTPILKKDEVSLLLDY